ncbi:MAG: DinB family protein [Chloroflexota bacterium]|nr:DinB family protein [Chloroflexota bacterium]
MTEYALYLESGPKRRKTMVHVFDLLGCVAVGPTTEAALHATPDAIRTYLRFLKRHGEPVDPKAPLKTRVAEHIAEIAIFIGQGSPYITFDPDLQPVSECEIETFLARFHWMREELAAWVETQSGKQLDARPQEGGRPARGVLLHVMSVGGYLSAALAGAPGFGTVQGKAERGEISLAEGLRTVAALAAERVRGATPEQRRAVLQRPKDVRTLRKALRRTLEHDWEHLTELSRRSGGPKL